MPLYQVMELEQHLAALALDYGVSHKINLSQQLRATFKAEWVNTEIMHGSN